MGPGRATSQGRGATLYIPGGGIGGTRQSVRLGRQVEAAKESLEDNVMPAEWRDLVSTERECESCRGYFYGHHLKRQWPWRFCGVCVQQVVDAGQGRPRAAAWLQKQVSPDDAARPASSGTVPGGALSHAAAS